MLCSNPTFSQEYSVAHAAVKQNPRLSPPRPLVEVTTASAIPPMYVFRLDLRHDAMTKEHLGRFFKGTQHDHIDLNWNYSTRSAGDTYLSERMKTSGMNTANAATAQKRRPDCPMPLARQIVERFTELVIGDPPIVRTPADPKTAAYLEAVFRECSGWTAVATARTYKGIAMSSVLVVTVIDGKPFLEPLKSCDIWVRSWEQSPGWIPKEVIHQQLVCVDEWDQERKAIVQKKVWRTRFWNQGFAVAYKDVPEKWSNETHGAIPVAGVGPHAAGRCPVVWLQNTQNLESPDGVYDLECEQVLQMCDRLDQLQSNVVRAAGSNAEPTIVVEEDPNVRLQSPIEKGSGKKIDVSKGGSVKFLETSGASVEMGWLSVAHLTDSILRTVRQVVVDPKTAGTYKSGEALAMLWRSAEKKANGLRGQLTREIRQICEILIAIGEAIGVGSVEEKKGAGILLPPLIKQEALSELKDDDEEEIETGIHEVGTAKWIDIQYRPYQKPTALALQATTAALATATGAKQYLSVETAISVMTKLLGEGNVKEELMRILAEREKALEAEVAMQNGGNAMGGAKSPGDPIGGGSAVNDKVLRTKAPHGAAPVRPPSKPAKPTIVRKKRSPGKGI